MPIAFIGHGAPTTSLTDERYTQELREFTSKIKTPKAILMISAHWVTEELKVSSARTPQTIYDFFGFPPELYKMQYNAPGAPELAAQVKQLLNAKTDPDQGLDHGVWCVLKAMYPEASIPVTQLSLSAYATPEEHFAIARQLDSLRDSGILILGSGNIVHNLSVFRRANVQYNSPLPSEASTFDDSIVSLLLTNRFKDIVHYEDLPGNEFSVPTPEHFWPLIYIAALANSQDTLEIIRTGSQYGGISMTSLAFMPEERSQ